MIGCSARSAISVGAANCWFAACERKEAKRGGDVWAGEAGRAWRARAMSRWRWEGVYQKKSKNYHQDRLVGYSQVYLVNNKFFLILKTLCCSGFV